MRVSGGGDERRMGIAGLVRAVVKPVATKIGTSLRLAGLWLLLAVPPADVVWEHHPRHFWLVFAAAALSAWRALTVGGAARHHGDARLLLVGLGFLAAALLCGLHALATPGVLLDDANGGALALSAVFGAAAALNVDGRLGERAVRAGPYLRWGSSAWPRCGVWCR
jgi:adenylate cyclase